MTDGNDSQITPATNTAAADVPQPAAPQPPAPQPPDPTSEPVVELSTADPVPEEG